MAGRRVCRDIRRQLLLSIAPVQRLDLSYEHEHELLVNPSLTDGVRMSQLAGFSAPHRFPGLRLGKVMLGVINPVSTDVGENSTP